ncbi:uncharacterized protein [Asterias amurensis]|uniref:uncharacterized protein isoform X1 n=1 Tax=Asterias amurensis TaxID=7602 RepID=UPI003AB5F545
MALSVETSRSFIKSIPGRVYSHLVRFQLRLSNSSIRNVPLRSRLTSARRSVRNRLSSFYPREDARGTLQRRTVGDESAEESDWSSEEEGSSKRPRTDSGHRKARRSQRAGKARKPKNNAGAKDTKPEEKAKGKASEDASSQPRAPMTSLAEILSSKEGLKSAGQKSNSKENISASDEVDGKGAKDVKNVLAVPRKSSNADATSPTVIKIKPPPPKAPKPKAKRTSSTKSTDTSGDKTGDTKRNDKTFSFGSLENIFDGMEVTQPKLTSYKRTMGPQGRRLPQRYSNQSQRYSNQSRNSMTAVSA